MRSIGYILLIGLLCCGSLTTNIINSQFVDSSSFYSSSDTVKMKQILYNISTQMIRLHEFDYSDSQTRSNWFGNKPATLNETDRGKIKNPSTSRL